MALRSAAVSGSSSSGTLRARVDMEVVRVVLRVVGRPTRVGVLGIWVSVRRVKKSVQFSRASSQSGMERVGRDNAESSMTEPFERITIEVAGQLCEVELSKIQDLRWGELVLVRGRWKERPVQVKARRRRSALRVWEQAAARAAEGFSLSGQPRRGDPRFAIS